MKNNRLIQMYDKVKDKETGKIGFIVYITDGNFAKGIPQEYLFEPQDSSFDPVFRTYYELEDAD